jgi:hypothetical protein
VGIPVELKYTEAHEWVRTGRDGVWTVGITHHAQDALGEIVSIELLEPGQKASAEAPVAVIESVTHNRVEEFKLLVGYVYLLCLVVMGSATVAWTAARAGYQMYRERFQ